MYKDLINHIVNWLHKYCNNSNLNGFIVGISGGIDSAVTSTLCAMTGKKTLIVNLPILQTDKHLQRIFNHSIWLKKFKNIELLEIELTKVSTQFQNLFSEDVCDNLTIANLRSRIRMLTLYTLANKKKKIVVGTGNKIEDFGIGFFTKYGDGGVDISPIADLTKSQVYVIAKKIGITDNIINAKPTDGLWPDNRSDEIQIGATYDELEWAMDYYNNNKKQFFINLEERAKYIMNIYLKAQKKNFHKIKPIPVCNVKKRLF